MQKKKITLDEYLTNQGWIKNEKGFLSLPASVRRKRIKLQRIGFRPIVPLTPNVHTATPEEINKYGIDLIRYSEELKKYNEKKNQKKKIKFEQEIKNRIVTLSPEIWKDIKGFEGLYRISNHGNIFSLSLKRNLKLYRLDSPSKRYMAVALYKNNVRKTFIVHRLIAKAFVPNPFNKKFVCHLDTDPFNNVESNLIWSDLEEKIQRSIFKKESHHNFSGVLKRHVVILTDGEYQILNTIISKNLDVCVEHTQKHFQNLAVEKFKISPILKVVSDVSIDDIWRRNGITGLFLENIN